MSRAGAVNKALWVVGAILLILLSLAVGCSGAAPTAKHVILFIGDGWGYNHYLATSYYQYGRSPVQIYEQFAVQLAVSTFPLNGSYDPERAWSEFNYVTSGATDSAAAATALATGIKVKNGVLSVDPSGAPLTTVLERAEELGRATGVVSSVPFSHATPAAFVAHCGSRGDYRTIAQQMLVQSAADVIMGTGHPLFDNAGQPVAIPEGEEGQKRFSYVGGKEVWEQLCAGRAGGDADGDGQPDPWTLIQTAAEFQTLTQGETPHRVLGIPQVHDTLQQARPTVDRNGDGKPDGKDIKLAAPYEDPLTPSVPSLATMTAAALNVLDDDPDGFFLMVEGGAIDWACHSNQAARMIEEAIDFNRAIEVAVTWVQTHRSWQDSLVIVTADHETGYLTGPGSDPDWKPLVNNGPGSLPGLEWHSGNHTNSLVPLFANGDAAALFLQRPSRTDPRRGPYVDNTDVAWVILRAQG